MLLLACTAVLRCVSVVTRASARLLSTPVHKLVTRILRERSQASWNERSHSLGANPSSLFRCFAARRDLAPRCAVGSFAVLTAAPRFRTSWPTRSPAARTTPRRRPRSGGGTAPTTAAPNAGNQSAATSAPTSRGLSKTPRRRPCRRATSLRKWKLTSGLPCGICRSRSRGTPNRTERSRRRRRRRARRSPTAPAGPVRRRTCHFRATCRWAVCPCRPVRAVCGPGEVSSM